MKFRRAFKGRGLHVYTIRAGSYYVDNWGMRLFRNPLRAEFVQGFFDSAAAAKSLQWTKDEQELVERTLMAHGDFGHGLYLDASEPQVVLEGSEIEEGQEPEETTHPQTLCIASVETDGESTLCGKPTVDAAGEFCAKHAAEYAEAGV